MNRGITCLAKKNLLAGMKQTKVKRCVHFLAGKQKRVSFQSHTPSRKSELLELVHFRFEWSFQSEVNKWYTLLFYFH